MAHTREQSIKVAKLMTRGMRGIDRSASLDEAMELMDAGGIRHLPVLDGQQLVGMLSERDLLETTGWLPRRMREVIDAPTGSVEKFMHSPVVTVSPEDSLVTAALRMITWNIGCLPVLHDVTPVGMLTDSDVLRAYAGACRGVGASVDSDPYVEAIMTAEVISAESGTPADEALAYCRAKKIRHLPIMDGYSLVGFISDRDLRMSVGRGQLEGTPIGELGSGELVTTGPGERLSRAAELLIENRIGAIPVISEQRLVGLLSSSDILSHCTRTFATKPDHIEA